MTTIQNGCARALANLVDVIDSKCRFPRNVFKGNWGDFFFFDSDWMFDVNFVEQVKAFLDVENGTCACISNLEIETDSKQQARQLIVDRQTNPDEYQSLLFGGTTGVGWIYDFGSFASTSDVSQWCIYCERRNEIAVIAIRQGIPVTQYMSLLAQYRAMRIDEAIRQRLSYGFSAKVLSAPWRSELIQEYATRMP